MEVITNSLIALAWIVWVVTWWGLAIVAVWDFWHRSWKVRLAAGITSLVLLSLGIGVISVITSG